MKIPLAYPKIPDTTRCPLKKCIAFEKIDGSNLFWKWNNKNGWYQFGTRRNSYSFDKEGILEFQSEHQQLYCAPQIFNDKYRDKLNIYFAASSNFSSKEIIIFTEFYGPNSFAGQHSQEDLFQNNQTLTTIDISVDNCFLDPELLINISKDKFDLPKVIYKGKYSGQLVEDIRNGKYGVDEGAVIKGVVDGKVYMAKVKTNEYMTRLKNEFKENWKDYWE